MQSVPIFKYIFNVYKMCFRNLCRDLIRVVGCGELLGQTREQWYSEVYETVQQLISFMDDLPELPKTKADGFYPLEILLNAEVEGWKHMLHTVRRDIQILRGITCGDTCCIPSYEMMMREISQHRIPASWLQSPFHSNTPLTTFFKHMSRKFELLATYVQVLPDLCPSLLPLSTILMYPTKTWIYIFGKVLTATYCVLTGWSRNLQLICLLETWQVHSVCPSDPCSQAV